MLSADLTFMFKKEGALVVIKVAGVPRILSAPVLHSTRSSTDAFFACRSPLAVYMYMWLHKTSASSATKCLLPLLDISFVVISCCFAGGKSAEA
jgi:hypothetical protein